MVNKIIKFLKTLSYFTFCLTLIKHGHLFIDKPCLTNLKDVWNYCYSRIDGEL